MMSAASDGEERVAEILREILALSGTKQVKHSKSTPADDSIKLLDTQCANGPKSSAPCGKQRNEKLGKSEGQDSRS